MQEFTGFAWSLTLVIQNSLDKFQGTAKVSFIFGGLLQEVTTTAVSTLQLRLTALGLNV